MYLNHFVPLCTRARLSSDGKFYGCLFASSEGFDVKTLIRNGATDDDLKHNLNDCGVLETIST